MVREIIWSEKAAFERKEILNYWIARNKSNSYNKKLNNLFQNNIRLIVEFPDLGTETDVPNVRVRVVNVYLIFYEVVEDEIWILCIWDGRRNPENLKIK